MVNFKLKDYNMADTVAAIATFPSKSALGVIKVSGPRAVGIVAKIFVPKRKKDIRKVKTHTLHYGWIIERPKTKDRRPKTRKRDTRYEIRDTNIVDEVLVSIMRKPHTYTREDVVEISGHGGVFVLNKILQLVLARGARLALPGEFTYRALVRGRIDVFQAEGILSLVDSASEEGAALAVAQLRGEASNKIKALREDLKQIFVRTEAFIDFPDEQVDISLAEISRQIKDIETKLGNLLRGSKEAGFLRQGLRCVICGRANVGKSTLFNCLLDEERVIVSRRPGTTRDVIEETINVRGIPLRIYDTAGILEPQDLVAKKAVERTARAFKEADLVMLVVDGTRRLTEDDFFLLRQAQDKNTILVINKSDVPQKIKPKDIPWRGRPKVRLSALKRKGIKSLEEVIQQSVYRQGANPEDKIFLNHFQQQALEQAQAGVIRAGEFLSGGHTIDLVSLALGEALSHLGRLSGEVLSREILETMFSNFCIGK